MKKIYIYQGDENRAKIEEELKEDIFFVDVYRKAADILKELLEESREYKKITEMVDCENTQYQRIGNNVIAFCASRGQGKTSAMKSFAKYLSNGYGNNSKIMDPKILLENQFVVLDSVDPAALDSGESLVRVVISRIFYLLDKKYKNNRSQFMGSQEKKNRLLELFQECYGSIDYLRGRRKRDDGQDDLEQLAALGNSARLKMNLIELIELFLEIYTDEGGLIRESDKRNKFLVVPIDDVDICTGNIYKCCEEIRNYLTLPNVIVLMAADYAQLHRVIFQKYLQINKELMQYEKGFKSVCNRQASEYLLKLLPNNHVIELPQFVSLSGREWRELRLVYYKKAEIGAEKTYKDIFEGDLRLCGNLQEQIIRIIYDRTGIIIWGDEERFWKFLPQTMRELTQLIKKLTQGSDSKIDQQKLYRLDDKDNPIPDEEQVNVLLNNISLFKNFFLDNWCINSMTPAQYNEFRDWIRVLENRKRSGIFNFKLNDMLEEESHAPAGDVNDAQYENYEEKTGYSDEMPPQSISGDFIAMYLTIFLNEWFAEALQDKEGEQYKRIVDFLDGENGLLQCPAKTNVKTKYDIYYFPTEEQFLKTQGVSDKLIKSFCVEKEGKFYFDFFNPWRFILLNGGAASTMVNGEEGNTSETEDGNENVVIRNNLDLRMAIKTIISNCGIYSHMLKEMKKIVTKENNMPNWRDIVNNFFYENDIWLTHLKFLQLNTDNIGLFAEYYRKSATLWDKAFISNKNNCSKYYSEYKKQYGWIFSGTDINDKELISFISNWGNTNSAVSLGVIRDLSVENCKGNRQLKEMVLSQRAILSKQEEIVALRSQSAGEDYDLQKIRTMLEGIRTEYQQLIKEKKSESKRPE